MFLEHNPQLQIGKKVLEYSSIDSYLGVDIDIEPRFKSHISGLISKVYNTLTGLY